MPTVNGQAAVDRFRQLDSVDYGLCLFYVWRWGYKWQGAEWEGPGATAMDGWESSGDKHWGDKDAPVGVPMWLGPRPGNSAGDVVISLGGGWCRATDFAWAGRVGECHIDTRLAQTGRPYLGWTGEIAGNKIEYAGRLPGGQNDGPHWGRRKSERMELFYRESNNAHYVAIPGKMVKHVPNAEEERLIGYQTGDTFKGYNDGDLSVALWFLGFPDLQGNLDALPLNGQYLFR